MTRAALISLEPWDHIWRRNQHLATQLVQQGLVSSIDFVEPAIRHPKRRIPLAVPAGVTVVRPRLLIPKRAGGLAFAAQQLKARLRHADLLWINDPAFGVHCLSAKQPALYDVTDDWRSYDFPPRITRRIVRAEDRLARRATTVVCSPELQGRWQQRYDVKAAVVTNGIDLQAWRDVQPRELPGTAPHVGYIGTAQSERLDIDLVLAVADDPAVGTLHLVGPDALDDDSRQLCQAHPKVLLHGPVAAIEVPSWTVSMDVLICPHRISAFTLSLDAIKSREYLASGKPIVATPTSGFQEPAMTSEPTVSVQRGRGFIMAVAAAISSAPRTERRPLPDLSWATRAREFAAAWSTAAGAGAVHEMDAS